MGLNAVPGYTLHYVPSGSKSTIVAYSQGQATLLSPSVRDNCEQVFGGSADAKYFQLPLAIVPCSRHTVVSSPTAGYFRRRTMTVTQRHIREQEMPPESLLLFCLVLSLYDLSRSAASFPQKPLEAFLPP